MTNHRPNDRGVHVEPWVAIGAHAGPPSRSADSIADAPGRLEWDPGPRQCLGAAGRRAVMDGDRAEQAAGELAEIFRQVPEAATAGAPADLPGPVAAGPVSGL